MEVNIMESRMASPCKTCRRQCSETDTNSKSPTICKSEKNTK